MLSRKAFSLCALIFLGGFSLVCDSVSLDPSLDENSAPPQESGDVLALACPAPPNGTAPISPPTGGFAIDGNLRSNDPTLGIGDWIPGLAGVGTSALSSAGCPLDNANTRHFLDTANSSTDDNFSGGQKVDQNPNQWTWVKNPVNAKQDLKHALIHAARNPANGHFWIVIAATRESNNGDSYIDFEFMQNPLSLSANPGGASGKFVSGGPNGGRTVNDFILTLNLTKGGTQAGLCVSRWKASGSGFDYFDDTANLPANAVFTAVNLQPVVVPGCPSGSDPYAMNSFAEAAVDLTALVGDFDPCLTLAIQNILIKTKESASPSANIVDFIAPIPVNLVIGPSAGAGDDQSKCSEGASTSYGLTGTANAGTNPIASMTWSVVSGNATIDAPLSCSNCTSLPATAHVTSGTAVLRLTTKDTFDCEKTDDIQLGVNICTGACCVPNTTGTQCHDNYTTAQCEAAEGTFHPGDTCADAPCGPQSCNLPDLTDVNIEQCNPATIPGCDAASITPGGCTVGAVTCQSNDSVDGCMHTRTLTYRATACAGGTCQTVQHIRWKEVSAPAFDNCGQTVDLGCSPATLPTCDTYASFGENGGLGTVTASNACGPVEVTCCQNPGDGGTCDNADHVGNCMHMRTFKFTATNCGLTNTCTRTFVWRVE